MPNHKNLALGTLALATLASSQLAFAHTRLETPSVTEGTKVHNYVVIGHGCPPSSARQPTYGTSVVFPNAITSSPIIGVDSGAGKTYTTNPASSYYSPLSGIGTYIRGGGAWDAGMIKVDALGNNDGFWSGGKAYDQTVSTPVVVPFFSAAISIAPKSCARSVTFELAIADICDGTVPSTTAADQQVLFWSPIPNFTGVPGQPFGTPAGDATRKIPSGPKFSNYDGYQDANHTIPGDGWGSPATLKVNRDLTKNPLPAGCSGNGGKGDDVYIYPAAEQINREMPAFQSIRQAGPLFWY